MKTTDARSQQSKGETAVIGTYNLSRAQLRTAKANELFYFGQYTDDSQLARELLQSFVGRGRFDPADYAARLAAVFGEQRIVGRGRATTLAAERLLAGVPWSQSGEPAPTAGNGSAMRAGPIGLIFHAT